MGAHFRGKVCRSLVLRAPAAHAGIFLALAASLAGAAPLDRERPSPREIRVIPPLSTAGTSALTGRLWSQANRDRILRPCVPFLGLGGRLGRRVYVKSTAMNARWTGTTMQPARCQRRDLLRTITV